MPLLTCPNDGAGMQEVNRNGVLIDVCPQCRGVWLDRGEMEKLLSYSRAENGYDDDDTYERRSYGGKPRKKRFKLSDFFD